MITIQGKIGRVGISQRELLARARGVGLIIEESEGEIPTAKRIAAETAASFREPKWIEDDRHPVWDAALEAVDWLVEGEQ